MTIQRSPLTTASTTFRSKLPGRQKGFWPSQYQGLTSPGTSFRMKNDGVEHRLKPWFHEARCKNPHEFGIKLK